MQKPREHGVFNQVVSGKSVEVKAGDLIGHLRYHERPETAPQHFCHLRVFSQDQRMEANKAGVTKGAAQLHTLANKTLWKPPVALYNLEYINKLVWMTDVPEIRSSETLWHMHPVVFLEYGNSLTYINNRINILERNQ